MTDQRFTELLGKQLAGELSPEESVDFKEMLSSNESYRQEYQNLSTYFSQKEVPDQNIDIVFNKITSKISTAATPNLKPQRNLGMWLKIAAVFVVAICGFLMYKALLSSPNTRQSADLEIAAYTCQSQTKPYPIRWNHRNAKFDF